MLSRTVITKDYVATRGNLISDLWYAFFCYLPLLDITYISYLFVFLFVSVQDIIPTLNEIIRRFDEADDRLYLAYLYMEILEVYCGLPQLQDKTLLALLV